MRKVLLIRVLVCLCALACGILRADTFQLTDGRTLSGEVITGSADDNGIQIRLEENRYERVAWLSFSQDDLKKFAADDRNPKMAQFARSFIEVPPADRVHKLDVQIREVPRLERPVAHSLLGALLSSGVGVLVLLLVYAANLYAAYEISIFRARPVVLVCGVSAVVPLIGPAVFLAIPPRREEAEAVDAPPLAPAVIQPFAGSRGAFSTPSAAEPEHAGGARLAPGESAQSTTSIPQAQVFKRGTFTFNRRFFETKFPGFFGVVRRDADKDMVLVVKSARGEFVTHRISRIGANEVHLQIQRGAASEEVLVPFSEIQEVKLQHVKA